jgi:hypothetical protein
MALGRCSPKVSSAAGCVATGIVGGPLVLLLHPLDEVGEPLPAVWPYMLMTAALLGIAGVLISAGLRRLQGRSAHPMDD